MERSKPGFPPVPLPVQLVMSNAPREAGLVEALEACREEARFAVHPGASQGADEQAYSEPELYDSLLSQTLR